MSGPDDDDFADYYRKGVPPNSPEVTTLLLAVTGVVLLATLAAWLVFMR